MTAEFIETITTKELHGVKFGMDTKTPQGQTSGSDQGALGAYSDGTKGLATTAEMQKLVELVIEIRSTLMANGMMKGSA